ncbi:MAG: hypothetical protein ACREBW_02875 [Candidatus Micrarchaeaceae archaeon]
MGYVRINRDDPGTVISPKQYERYGLSQPGIALHDYNERIAQTQPLRLGNEEVQNIAITLGEIERRYADTGLSPRDIDYLLQSNLQGYPAESAQGSSGRPLAAYMTAGALHDRQSVGFILKDSTEGLLTAVDEQVVERMILSIDEGTSLTARTVQERAEVVNEVLNGALRGLHLETPSD